MSSADKGSVSLGCFKEKEGISVPLEDALPAHKERVLPEPRCHFGWGQPITARGDGEVLLLQAEQPVKTTCTD